MESNQSDQTKSQNPAAAKLMQTPLKNCEVFGSFSVDDLEAARHFYENTLGLEVESEHGMGFTINFGELSFFVYPKVDHTPATFTILNFEVDNIEQTVETLTTAGVEFEDYGGEIATDADHIHRSGEGPVMAWFKDPCGNILSVIEKRSLSH